MDDRGRCNVAMTRAKGVFWMLGGSLRPSRPGRLRGLLTPFPKLKREMEGSGRVHRLPPPPMEGESRAEPWCETQSVGVIVQEENLSLRPRL